MHSVLKTDYLGNEAKFPEKKIKLTEFNNNVNHIKKRITLFDLL